MERRWIIAFKYPTIFTIYRAAIAKGRAIAVTRVAEIAAILILARVLCKKGDNAKYGAKREEEDTSPEE